jgi:hypothetical protein
MGTCSEVSVQAAEIGFLCQRGISSRRRTSWRGSGSLADCCRALKQCST